MKNLEKQNILWNEFAKATDRVADLEERAQELTGEAREAVMDLCEDVDSEITEQANEMLKQARQAVLEAQEAQDFADKAFVAWQMGELENGY